MDYIDLVGRSSYILQSTTLGGLNYKIQDLVNQGWEQKGIILNKDGMYYVSMAKQKEIY